MDWFLSLLTNTSGVGHIVMLYAFVIAVGIALGRVKIGGKKNGIALGVTFVLFVGILMGHLYKSAGVVSEEGFAAHEFLTWRRCLRQMALSLFK